MIRSRVCFFLAISLFLSVYVSAEATEAPAAADKYKAESAVEELKTLTAGVVENAEKISSEAESVKTNVEDEKRKADSAVSDAKTAAESIKATNRKAEAAAVAKEAEKELRNCNTLYDEAKVKAEEASTALKEFVTRASTLDNKAKNDLLPASSQSANYAQAIESAKTATSDTTALSGEINDSTLLGAAKGAFSALQAGTKKVQMLKYKAESIAVVSRIEAMVSEAATDIQSIEGKKEEINTIVQAMNIKCESASDLLKISLTSLCNNAESQLGTATNKVQEAKQCTTDMQGKKTQVDTAFEAVKVAAEESDAKINVATLLGHEKFFADEIEKIKQALRAVENAFSNAQNAQQQMQNKMSQQISQSGSEGNKGRQTDNVRTAEVTNPIRSGEANSPAITKKVQQPAMKSKEPAVIKTEKPTVTETEKTALGKSKDTMDKTSEQPVDAKLDKTKQNKSTQVTDNKKQNPKDDNSKLFNNEKLRNIKKDITNNSLIGGEVPTRSAANDSSVTVFIPLLVALILCAVLH